MICPNCNQQINDTSKFCPYCGQKMCSTRKICPSCNKEYETESGFCEGCGMKLVEKNAQSTPLPNPAPKPQYAHATLVFKIHCELRTNTNVEDVELNVYSDRLEFKVIRDLKGYKVINEASGGQVLRTHTYYINDIAKIDYNPMWRSPVIVILIMRDGKKLKLFIFDRDNRNLFVGYMKYAIS